MVRDLAQPDDAPTMPKPPMRSSSDRPDDARAPSLDAMHAGTLALMTCLIEQLETPKGDAGASADPSVLQALRRKIEANLDLLRQHPALSPAMSLVVTRLHERWRCRAHGDGKPCCRATIEEADMPMDGRPAAPVRWH